MNYQALILEFIKTQKFKALSGLTGWRLALAKIILKQLVKYLTRANNWSINKAIEHAKEEKEFEEKKLEQIKKQSTKESGSRFL